MSKSTYIDAVRVASPCDAEWDEMTGNDRIRFCGHCSKSVTDLSTFRRKDAARLVREANGKLCIRYIPDPTTQSPMFAEQLVQISRHAPRVAVGVLSATISLTSIASAQLAPQRTLTLPLQARTPLELKTVTSSTDETTAAETDTEPKTGTIQGTIRDRQGKELEGVELYLANESDYEGEMAFTDENGHYKFDELTPETYVLRVRTTSGELRKIAPGIVITGDESITQDINVRTHITYIDGTGTGIGTSVSSGFGGASYAIAYRSPLFDAVADNDATRVKQLLESGEKANQKDKNYSDITPLFLAVENGNTEIARLLIQYGAKVNAKNSLGRTPLGYLDSDTTPELIRMMFQAGATLNTADKYGETPLISAASYQNAEAVKTLVELGAEINAVDEEGVTALMTAVKNESADTVSALIMAGADISLKNKAGDTAWDISSDPVIEKLLVDAGAVVNYDVEVEVEVFRGEDEPSEPEPKPIVTRSVQAKVK